MSLTPGRYALAFSKEGFNRYVRRGTDLHVEIITDHAELNVGATSQSVEVTAEASLLRAENSDNAPRCKPR
ncbi:MAG TPA: hypothetical protein VER03_08830 [Bryobacteraceae bacterium]|nr:hypothetical protein [Bryobacteraceae bacterium]